MKKISSFLLASFLALAIYSPVLSQDIPAPTGSNPNVFSGVNTQNQIFDGPGHPNIQSTSTVLPGNNSTSGNGRAPQGSRRFINTKYIITGTEMTASGFSGLVTSIGWRWNVPSPPAAGAPAAQSTASTGNLRVYLKDTSGTAPNFAGTFIDTNGVGYTKVIDGTISIPAGLAEINIDVPVGGPGTAPYTPTPGMGQLLIYVYKTTDATLPTPLGAPTCFCTTTGAGTMLLTYQSQTVGGSTGGSSVFRPETRFGVLDLADDMGVSALTSNPASPACAGASEIFTATAKNFGTTTQAAGVPVVLRVDGVDVETKFTTISLAQNATENITFTGMVLSPGSHVIKSYTQLTGDQKPANDTTTISYLVLNTISTFPYLETFTNPVDWTVSGAAGLWTLRTPLTNPAGKSPDTAAECNFYSIAAGNASILKSPPLDFTGLSNPVIHFYVAYRTFIDENDSMQVLISTDCGLTFNDVPVPYRKAENSVPSLATRNPSTTQYFPDSASQWRHETIDLLAYAGNSNVMIGFRGRSAFGNNLFIDNFIATNADSYCASAVTLPQPYSCNPMVIVDFIDVGLNSSGNIAADNLNGVTAKKLFEENQGSSNPFTSSSVNSIVNSGNTISDNPTGGDLSVTQHTNNAPPSVANPVLETNTTATAPDGSIFTPAFIYNNFWFTTTYTGEDKAGYPTYNLTIDLIGIGVVNPDKLYILKRADMTGSWTCQSTNRVGTLLTASGLNIFCDFALAGDDFPLPVELSSFVSVINGRNVTLNWTTSTEQNNAGFDIEKSIANGEWSRVGNVSGNGSTTSPHSYTFTDRNLNAGNYNYRLKQIDLNGNFTYFNLGNEVIIGVPVKFDLSQNYPNPFNPSTKINYDLPFDGKVSVKVFDMSGKEVKTLVNDVKTAGYYTINFNASDLSSGAYFYRISAEANGQNFVSTKKMMLIK